MPIETHVFAAGAYRKAKDVFVKDGGVWRDLKEIWVNDQGVWRKVFTKFFEFNADISGLNYNLRNAVMATGQWDGVTPVLANLRVVGNLGSQPPAVPAHNGSDTDHNQLRRQRMADYVNYPAFDSGSLPASSEINLTVMPGVYLVGAGGVGGHMYHTTNVSYKDNQQLDVFSYMFENGGPGSPAIRTTVLTRITNNGVIGGGGGGGAGAIGAVSLTYWNGKKFNSFTQGGMGGGGAGYVGGQVDVIDPTYDYDGNVCYSNPGTLTTGGSGGGVWIVNGGASGTRGGNGGALGQKGGDGGSQLPLDISGFPRHIRYGGEAGKAVIGSSNVVWQAYGDVRGPLA